MQQCSSAAVLVPEHKMLQQSTRFCNVNARNDFDSVLRRRNDATSKRRTATFKIIYCGNLIQVEISNIIIKSECQVRRVLSRTFSLSLSLHLSRPLFLSLYPSHSLSLFPFPHTIMTLTLIFLTVVQESNFFFKRPWAPITYYPDIWKRYLGKWLVQPKDGCVKFSTRPPS